MTPPGQPPRTPAATSHKKVILAIVGVVGTLALVVALFVGVIVGFVFYTLNHSEAAQTSRAFLHGNELLRPEILLEQWFRGNQYLTIDFPNRPRKGTKR